MAFYDMPGEKQGHYWDQQAREKIKLPPDHDPSNLGQKYKLILLNPRYRSVAKNFMKKTPTIMELWEKKLRMVPELTSGGPGTGEKKVLDLRRFFGHSIQFSKDWGQIKRGLLSPYPKHLS